MLVRQQAALMLLGKGDLEPWEALAVVVWPPKSLEQPPTGRRVWGEQTRERARQLHKLGVTYEGIAAQVGAPPSTVKQWLSGRNGGRARVRRVAEVQERTGRLF
jgi:hypothetical protein